MIFLYLNPATLIPVHAKLTPEYNVSLLPDTIANTPRGTRIRKATSTNFTVAHYCKKVEYNARDFPEKNHDFLPPEMIETMRQSSNFVIKQLFTNRLTKSGNLTISTEQNLAIFTGTRRKWGAALVSGDKNSRVSAVQYL